MVNNFWDRCLLPSLNWKCKQLWYHNRKQIKIHIRNFRRKDKKICLVASNKTTRIKVFNISFGSSYINLLYSHWAQSLPLGPSPVKLITKLALLYRQWNYRNRPVIHLYWLPPLHKIFTGPNFIFAANMALHVKVT